MEQLSLSVEEKKRKYTYSVSLDKIVDFPTDGKPMRDTLASPDFVTCRNHQDKWHFDYSEEIIQCAGDVCRYMSISLLRIRHLKPISFACTRTSSRLEELRSQLG